MAHKLADCIDCRINQHIRRLAKESGTVFREDDQRHLRAFGRAVARAVKREIEKEQRGGRRKTTNNTRVDRL